MRAMLSIKPEFVEQIVLGRKKFEFRKVLFRQRVTTIVVYATKPYGKVVGEFNVSNILEDIPQSIWNQTSEYAGISKDFFDKYYSESDKAVAIEIGKFIPYSEPLTLKEFDQNIRSAPQSFIYLQ
ncbi:ASCH domain-containing protein [Lactiplantibacillus pentosus]|uniref:ASCH domain-containing protein n=1 Tax=Lactiplantibacillus pentosus TaxID=1589 RepID=UPI000D018F93|nr:ASCH domain-containing protein [Lactiplantibacillus pentosus]PRO82499.1 hypothetical protein C6Y10_12615 [Lactiplantibacillus pentosus]